MDDFDGETEAAATVTFTVDGTAYEMDLSAANLAEWQETIAPWTAAARRVRKPATRKAKPRRKGPSAAEIRVWAAENGHAVAPVGLVPKAVREAYAAAH